MIVTFQLSTFFCKHVYIHCVISIYSDCFLTGDTISVVAKISNSSSKTMWPKFSLQKEIKYHAGSSTNTNAQSLCKMVGDVIKDNSEETVSCQMKIPLDVTPTLHNCEIISVGYCLKVCDTIVMLHQLQFDSPYVDY